VLVSNIKAKNFTKIAVLVHKKTRWVVRIAEGKTTLGGDLIHDLIDVVEKKIADMLEKDEEKSFELLSAVCSEVEAPCNEEQALQPKDKDIDMTGERFELVHRSRSVSWTLRQRLSGGQAQSSVERR
jgi:hypothetical protein